MRYAPNNRRARSTRERRPAVKKISTVQAYMRENRGGAGELVRVRIKDRVLEHVLSLKDFPQLSDGFASWIGLTPDDAPLLMRDRSVQEIYALDLNFP
jgi:hypothetical protein